MELLLFPVLREVLALSTFSWFMLFSITREFEEEMMEIEEAKVEVIEEKLIPGIPEAPQKED